MICRPQTEYGVNMVRYESVQHFCQLISQALSSTHFQQTRVDKIRQEM